MQVTQNSRTPIGDVERIDKHHNIRIAVLNGIEQSNTIKTNKHKIRDTKTIKIFIAVSFLFVFSFLPFLFIILDIFESFALVYVYFINHIGNPITYLIIDKQFREQIRIDTIKLSNCILNN